MQRCEAPGCRKKATLTLRDTTDLMHLCKGCSSAVQHYTTSASWVGGPLVESVFNDRRKK